MYAHAGPYVLSADEREGETATVTGGRTDREDGNDAYSRSTSPGTKMN